MDITKEYPPALYVPYFDDMISFLVEKSGITFDVMLFMVLILMSIGLGVGYRFIRNTNMRHCWGLIFGIPF